jgi:hypothetical protein
MIEDRHEAAVASMAGLSTILQGGLQNCDIIGQLPLFDPGIGFR